jgi:hypothetical protein
MKGTNKCNTYFSHQKKRKAQSTSEFPNMSVAVPNLFVHSVHCKKHLVTNNILHRVSVHIFSQKQAYLIKLSETEVLDNKVITNCVIILRIYLLPTNCTSVG